MVNQTDVQMYTGYYDFGVFRVFGILSGEVRFFREIREISLLQTRRVMKNSILLKKLIRQGGSGILVSVRKYILDTNWLSTS
jgi:hypothetical protein